MAKYKQIDFVSYEEEIAELKKKNKELNDFDKSQSAKLLKELSKAKKDIEFLGVQTKTFLLMADISKGNETTILEHIKEIYNRWGIIE